MILPPTRAPILDLVPSLGIRPQAWEFIYEESHSAQLSMVSVSQKAELGEGLVN